MTARYLAVKALVRQEQNGFADLVLDAELKKCTPPLSGRDAAFATAIFYTVVERLPLLDYTLGKALSRPLPKLDAPVRAILRAGLAQAQYMGIPPAAAVNESVQLARAFGKTSAAGMVNAVLRHSIPHRPDPDDFADPLDRLQTYYSLSAPVARLLYDQYGSKALLMAQAFWNTPPTVIRVNTLRTDVATLTAALQMEHTVHGPGPLPDTLRVTFNGSPAATKPFRDGWFHVQGLASQYAALCLQAQPGQKVLDLCAAPGGKSVLLAQQMQNTGLLLSNDVAAARVKLLRQALARTGVTCAQVECHDAATWQPEQAPFDRILCDVPCSGLGVIGKKPDIRYKSMDGVEALHALQLQILQNAAKMLAQNGRLVYSTCTVDRRENQEQIKVFLAANPDFTVVPPLPFPSEGPNLAPRTDGYGTLFLPHLTGTDGFFVSVLQKHP